MGKMSDKEKENIILKAVEAIQESINQIQVNYRVGQVCPQLEGFMLKGSAWKILNEVGKSDRNLRSEKVTDFSEIFPTPYIPILMFPT